MITVRGLEKVYTSGGRPLPVLRGIDLDISDGEMVAVVGPSGSGKTTLLGLLAGLDVPTRGSVRVDDTELFRLDEDARARFRARNVGFVFQSFHLLPALTALENVRVPLELLGQGGAAGEARARALLERVGLGERTDHYPSQLSGGEQQRVAVARAFVARPRILFADEPTGNLDRATGERIVTLLEELNHESETTLVLVTHDLDLAARAGRTIRLADGALVR
jgi:putative ABC transport system ATP-binding protein